MQLRYTYSSMAESRNDCHFNKNLIKEFHAETEMLSRLGLGVASSPRIIGKRVGNYRMLGYFHGLLTSHDTLHPWNLSMKRVCVYHCVYCTKGVVSLGVYCHYVDEKVQVTQ